MTQLRWPSRFVIVSFALASGCAGADSASNAAPITTRAVAGSALRIGTDSIVLERIARVGELDGAPEYAFGDVIEIAVRDDGGFYACDRQDVSIRLYDSTGMFLARIGRKGEGPAEYTGCYRLSIVGDSILWVTDFDGRFVAFAPDGSSRGITRVHGQTNPVYVDALGRFWWSRFDSEHYEQGVEKVEYMATDSKGRLLDSLEVPASRLDLAHRPFAISTIEGVYVSRPRDTLWSIAPDGARLIALPTSYRIERSGGARPALSFTRQATAVRYGAEEHAEWDAWRVWTDEASNRSEYSRTKLTHAAIPATKPFVRDVRGDGLGRIWVQVHVIAEKRDIPPRPPGNRKPLLTWRERTTFEIFDGERGEYIGRVALPQASELMAMRGDRIWTRTEGESGEQVIEIHQMRPARARQP